MGFVARVLVLTLLLQSGGFGAGVPDIGPLEPLCRHQLALAQGLAPLSGDDTTFGHRLITAFREVYRSEAARLAFSPSSSTTGVPPVSVENFHGGYAYFIATAATPFDAISLGDASWAAMDRRLVALAAAESRGMASWHFSSKDDLFAEKVLPSTSPIAPAASLPFSLRKHWKPAALMLSAFVVAMGTLFGSLHAISAAERKADQEEVQRKHDIVEYVMARDGKTPTKLRTELASALRDLDEGKDPGPIDHSRFAEAITFFPDWLKTVHQTPLGVEREKAIDDYVNAMLAYWYQVWEQRLSSFARGRSDEDKWVGDFAMDARAYRHARTVPDQSGRRTLVLVSTLGALLAGCALLNYLLASEGPMRWAFRSLTTVPSRIPRAAEEGLDGPLPEPFRRFVRWLRSLGAPGEVPRRYGHYGLSTPAGTHVDFFIQYDAAKQGYSVTSVVWSAPLDFIEPGDDAKSRLARGMSGKSAPSKEVDVDIVAQWLAIVVDCEQRWDLVAAESNRLRFLGDSLEALKVTHAELVVLRELVTKQEGLSAAVEVVQRWIAELPEQRVIANAK